MVVSMEAGSRLGLVRACKGGLARVGQGWGKNRGPQGSSHRRSNMARAAYWSTNATREGRLEGTLGAGSPARRCP